MAGSRRVDAVGLKLMEINHLERVRSLCLALPETMEKLSHGSPTFFVKKKVFTMFVHNHHNDGRIAVWIPVPQGFQAMLLEAAPEKFFFPPYVGKGGWVGIHLDRMDDDELASHIRQAWLLIAPKNLAAELDAR